MLGPSTGEVIFWTQNRPCHGTQQYRQKPEPKRKVKNKTRVSTWDCKGTHAGGNGEMWVRGENATRLRNTWACSSDNRRRITDVRKRPKRIIANCRAAMAPGVYGQSTHSKHRDKQTTSVYRWSTFSGGDGHPMSRNGRDRLSPALAGHDRPRVEDRKTVKPLPEARPISHCGFDSRHMITFSRA